ncbi:MAG: nitroreductase family protein [Christensenellales bacterium]|jgi:nitroreductase
MIDTLVRKNRSYRGYDERRRVSREELLQMVDCARLAPSSVNVQPLKYFLAYEEDVVRRIQPLTHWARALQPMQLPHPGHCPTAFIVICQDLSISDALPRFQKDVGIVAQTLLLKATEMGLGGCMIGNFSARAIQQALNLSETIAPVLVVAIGEPDETVVLTCVGPDGNTDYYRDGEDVHYVPKRSLEDVVLP